MLILRKEAEADIRAGYEWYKSKDLNLGASFMVELEAMFDKIMEHPKLYEIVATDMRRALCRRFPYAIYFTKRKSDLIVLAVLHQRRNPAAWQRS